MVRKDKVRYVYNLDTSEFSRPRWGRRAILALCVLAVICVTPAQIAAGDWLDDYETSAEPWPDDPDGKLWSEFMDKCMEGLRPKIEAALKGYEDSNFVKNFWGAM